MSSTRHPPTWKCHHLHGIWPQDDSGLLNKDDILKNPERTEEMMQFMRTKYGIAEEDEEGAPSSPSSAINVCSFLVCYSIA